MSLSKSLLNVIQVYKIPPALLLNYIVYVQGRPETSTDKFNLSWLQMVQFLVM